MKCLLDKWPKLSDGASDNPSKERDSKETPPKKDYGGIIELRYSSGSAEKKEEPVGNEGRLIAEINASGEGSQKQLDLAFEGLAETTEFQWRRFGTAGRVRKVRRWRRPGVQTYP